MFRGCGMPGGNAHAYAYPRQPAGARADENQPRKGMFDGAVFGGRGGESQPAVADDYQALKELGDALLAGKITAVQAKAAVAAYNDGVHLGIVCDVTGAMPIRGGAGLPAAGPLALPRHARTWFASLPLAAQPAGLVSRSASRNVTMSPVAR